MYNECTLFAVWSKEAAEALEQFKEKYGERSEGEPKRLDKALIRKRSSNGFNLVRDLHDLWLLVNEISYRSPYCCRPRRPCVIATSRACLPRSN